MLDKIIYSLKYQKHTPWGCKDIENTKFEFVAMAESLWILIISNILSEAEEPGGCCQTKEEYLQARADYKVQYRVS